MLHRNLLLPRDALELDASNPAFGTRPQKAAVERTPLAVSGNGLQSAGEEEDDFVTVELVDEMPSEVGVSSQCLQIRFCLQIQSRIMPLWREPIVHQTKRNLQITEVLKITTIRGGGLC